MIDDCQAVAPQCCDVFEPNKEGPETSTIRECTPKGTARLPFFSPDTSSEFATLAIKVGDVLTIESRHVKKSRTHHFSNRGIV